MRASSIAFWRGMSILLMMGAEMDAVNEMDRVDWVDRVD